VSLERKRPVHAKKLTERGKKSDAEKKKRACVEWNRRSTECLSDS